MRSRVVGHDWAAVTPRVLLLLGTPRTPHRDLMIAVLDAGPGAVVSHFAAAWLWRLPGFGAPTPEVSRPRSRSNCKTSIDALHHPTYLPASHVAERHGIPVTNLARTLFDVAAAVHPARLERLVDTVVSRTPSLLGALHVMLSELSRPGRGGARVMRAVLADRPSGYVAPASGLEARFARILAQAGEPTLERQVDVGGAEWVGRVDFLDRELRIVVEVDSDLHHTSPLDRAGDLRRDAALRDAGWFDVVRVTADEVWRQPAVAVARVRAARCRARQAAS